MKATFSTPLINVIKASALASALILMSPPVLAVSTDIADVPLAIKNSAKPNIMFILDNSGSMEWGSITGTDAMNAYDNTKVHYYSSLVNQLYYDPNTRYAPGISATSFSAATPEGGSLGDANATSTGALNNPYLAPTGGRTDLTKTCYYNGATPPVLPTGGSTSGTCRNYSASTYNKGPIAFVAYYYEYTGSGTPTPGSSTSYVRRDIIPSITTYTRSARRTDCSGTGSTRTCSYAQEIQNFANWFSYYRTRILTMKTTMGQAFAGLTGKYRVGFSTINNGSGTGNSTGENFLSIADFGYSTKSTWFTTLYAIDPGYGTPLQRALLRVGEYYSGNGMGYSTAGVGTGDPVQYSCQQNFSILSTDGFWNSNDVTTIGNADSTIPSVPTSNLSPSPVTGLTAGAQWPRPIYEGGTATSNTLADVAARYWITDLRPGMTNNVPVSSADAASWQHMTTFTIGLGADGSKPYREDYLTASTGFYRDVLNGADNWPNPAADSNRAIDDLWHAAVNGHGQYFSAKNPNSLRDSLRRVLDDIVARTGAAAAVAVANADVTVDNSSYASKYNSGNWTGDLASYPIDVLTGVPSTSATWSAQAKLDLSTVTADNRKIVTYSGLAGSNQGVQFRPAATPLGGVVLSKLSSAQQDALNSANTPPGPSDGADVLAFLRGDRSLESTAYRTRASRLGDIINAEPVVIGTPVFNYNDPGYVTFKASQSVTRVSPPATRIKTVFQGGNDGMMHAFRASDGEESWAYIPNHLFNGPSRLRDLSKITGFSHQYYVDATPASGDFDFNNTCPNSGCSSPPALTTPDWRTILVGGLGKGGRAYYALDVTTPTANSESDAASKVLWEFPNSSTAGTVNLTTPSGTTSNGLVMNVNKIGSTFGAPIITKTKAHGWVVLLTSGYNNGVDSGGDGHGYLFVLNARTGALLHVFDTGAGDSATPNGPSGLTHISGYAPDAQADNTVQFVYGGDLFGNVWRFDLSDTAVANWKLKKLATLVDGSGNAQPVTTPPELAAIVIDGVLRRFVYVGSGQYLGDTDIPGASGANLHASQTQTMYGLIDDLTNPTGATAVIASLRSSLQRQTLSSGSTNRTASTTNPDYTAKKGWYIDLPITGERVNTSPILSLGALIFTSNIPNSDVCTPGGSSWLNMLDYRTGGMIPGLDFASWSLGNVLASRPIVVQLADGSVKVIVRKSDATTQAAAGPPTSAPNKTRRVSWREVTED